MKAISNGWSDYIDIEIEQYLEPTYDYYTLKQGDKTIELGNQNRVREIIKMLTFIIS